MLTMLVMHSTPSAVLVHSVASLYGNAEDEVRQAPETAPCSPCCAVHAPHHATLCRTTHRVPCCPALAVPLRYHTPGLATPFPLCSPGAVPPLYRHHVPQVLSDHALSAVPQGYRCCCYSTHPAVHTSSILYLLALCFSPCRWLCCCSGSTWRAW